MKGDWVNYMYTCKWLMHVRVRNVIGLTCAAISSGLLEADRTPTQRSNAACSVTMPFSLCSSSALRALVFIVWNVTYRQGGRQAGREGGRQGGRGGRNAVREGGGGRNAGRKGGREGGTHLAGCGKDGGTLGEEVIVSGLQLNGLDQHRVTCVLVRPQHCQRNNKVHVAQAQHIHLFMYPIAI